MQIKRGDPLRMPKWKTSGKAVCITIRESELDNEIMSRLEAATKAIRDSKKADRVLVGTLPT